MTSKRAAVGIPVGVAAAVVVAIVATALLRSSGGGKPMPLPLSLAGSGGQAETAMDSKFAAGAPAGQGATYAFVGQVPDGLPDEGNAYRLSDGPVDRDDVRRLADVFGLKGSITTEPDALVVRDGELVLRVSTTPSRMWSYYREIATPPCDPGSAVTDPAGTEPALADVKRHECVGGGGVAGICLEGADSPCNDTPEAGVEGSTGSAGSAPSEAEVKRTDEEARKADAAASSGSSSSDSVTASSPVMVCPEPKPCPDNAKCAMPAISCEAPYEEPKQLPLPDESVARALAQRVFDATGLGKSVKMRTERGFDAWYISATIVIDGLEVIGVGHSVSIDTDGKVRDASGSLATEELLDRYPLVSAKAGLERLEKQQSGFRTMELCAPGPTGGVCAPGTPEKLEVTGVRLGLLFSPIWENEKEKVFLVPAWVYDIKGRDFPDAVFAITDEYLAGVSPVQVDPVQPEPLPADPTAVHQPDPGQSVSTPQEPTVKPPPPSSEPQPAPAEKVSAEPQPAQS